MVLECSSLLSLLALLLFLLFWERIYHQEFSVGWILLGLKVGLYLLWHENGSFKRLHQWDVNVFVFFSSRDIWLGQVVPNRLDLLKLLHSSTVCCVFRDEVELLGGSEFGQFRLTGRLGWSRLFRRLFSSFRWCWLPSRHPANQIVCCVSCVWSPVRHARWSIEDRKRDL